MQISIEQLKPIGSKVTSDLNKDKEPLEEMKSVVSFVDKVLEKQASFLDIKAERYFYDDFLSGISRATLKCTHFKSKEMVSTIVSLFIKMTKLFVREIDNDNDAYANAMRYVMDPDMSFYREFGVKMVEANTLQVHLDEDPNWRINLKAGNKLDAIKTESAPIKVSGWSTASIKSREEGKIMVVFDGEPTDEIFEFSLDSQSIRPHGTSTGGNEWRDKLKKGDVVDCLDTAANWFKATILDFQSESEENIKTTKVYIGYRIYHEEGVKTDSEGRAYTGWSNTYDEWINPYSIRIQRFNTISKIGTIVCKKAYDEEDKSKENIDDASDILLNSIAEQTEYAILRTDKVKSEIVVMLFNLFGKEGGFEKIMSRINNREKVTTYDLVYYYLDIIGTAWKLFHRKFLQSYLPKFKDAMINFFENTPDLELRKIQKERFERVLSNLEYLLRRTHTVYEKHKIIENFELSMYTVFLKSNYLQHRIDGLKGLNDICKIVNDGKAWTLKIAILEKWLASKNVIDELIGPRKHQQLVQRSAPIIRFLYERSKIETKTLEIMWEMTQDEQLRPDIFKVVSEIGFPLQSPEFEFFATKIMTMKTTEICEEALDVIFESHKNPHKSVEQLLKFANMLAEIGYKNEYPLNISEKALSKYADMITTLEYEPHKKEALLRCINSSLKKNINSVLSLRLIRKLVNQFVATSVEGLANTKSAIVDSLLKDAELLKIFFDNFEAYYKESREAFQKGNPSVTIDRYDHANNLNERMDFLGFILVSSSSTQKLPIEYLHKLWSLLYESPISPADSDILFNFLKSIAADQASYAKNFDPKEGKQFFEEKVANPKNRYQDLSMKAFACILQFFFLINEQEGLISITYPPAKTATSYTSYSSTTGPKYDNFSFNRGKDENAQPELKTKVHPANLNGIEVFWKIVQEANNNEVMEKSRDILNKLYTQLSGDVEKSSSIIQGAFIETYLNKLATLIESKDERKQAALDRMIRLMVDMIDESERKGTSGIKSHSALLKGDLIVFSVINKVTSGKEIPEKLEVEAYANTSIWEMKVELGKYFECSGECMKITVEGKELKDTDHGKTIGEFVQKRISVIVVDKRNMDDIPKAPLIGEDGKLTEKAKYAFIEVFNKFTKNGKMDTEGAVNYIQNITGDKSVTVQDSRIKNMFRNFDKDKDGLLTADEFCEFYKDSIMTKKEDVVRKNLAQHGFRNDLKRINEIEPPTIEISTLPRYILSSNPKSFELLFCALDIGGSSTEQVWDLINRLTTNDAIYKSLQNLDETEKPDWFKLIDTRSPFRLLYALQIINSFMESNAIESTITTPSTQKLAQLKTEEKFKKWRQNFIKFGGFEFLLSVLLNKDSTKGPRFNMEENIGKFEKECLGLLCGILSAFIRIAACTLNKGLYQQIIFAQSTYKKHLTSADQEQEEVAEKEAESKNTKKDEKKDEDSSKKSLVDVRELFKLKPSNILFLKRSLTEKKEISKDTIIEFESDLENAQAEAIYALVSSHDIWRRQLDDVTAIIMRGGNVDYHDTKIVKSVLQLFCCCIIANKAVFSLAKAYVNGETTFEKLIMFGVLHFGSQSTREEFADNFFFLCYMLKDKPKEERPLEYMLKILISNIPHGGSSSAKDCGEYFHLTCKLIDIYYNAGITTKEDRPFESKDLLIHLVEMIKKHKPTEKRNAQSEDKLLIGIINMIRKLLSHEPELKEVISIKEGLLREVFYNCLFPSIANSSETLPALAYSESSEGQADTQKCKTKESRTAAYKLLATLCKGSFSSQNCLVKECLEPLCASIKPHAGWSYVPTSESRSKLGYAGIDNLGCICYMISMIQQFYMIPTFRYGLLNADDKRLHTGKKPGDVDDNVLHQFQRIFANLECSERQSYYPKPFCYSFKDFDGNPVNTSVQQDAQEFLNLITDRIENMLRGTPDKYLVQSVFGGKTCSQIICQGGCGNVRKNYEDFYNLSVGVKGHKSLSESLNKYISGEPISDFMCEKCQKKVNVVKRTCLHQLPNVLIIHLQRIIFNFDTQANEKINSRLEFPKDISLEPYTVEGIEAREKQAANGTESNTDPFHGKGEDYYRYKLAGVVVHFGTADAGHYYSYINTNRKKGPHDEERDIFKEEKDLWLEYNDSRIRSFDNKKLESECFGGSSDATKETGFFSKFFDSNMKNAYMLIYERELKTPIKKVLTKEEIEKLPKNNEGVAAILECENTALTRTAIGQAFHDPSKNEYYTYINFNDIAPKVPPKLYQEIWEDNSNFLFERQIYSLEFFKFAQDILHESYSLLPSLTAESKGGIEVSLTRIATKIIYDVLARAYHNTLIVPFTEQLVKLFKQSETAIDEFLSIILKDSMKETFHIFYKCTDKDSRSAISDLIAGVVAAALPREGIEYTKYDLEQRGKYQVKKFRTKLGTLIHLLIRGIDDDLAENWVRFTEYFELLMKIIKCGGDDMLIYMNSREMISKLIDFYLGTDSPFYEKGEKRPIMGNKFRSPNFGPLIDIICYIATHANLTFMQPQDAKIREQFGLPKVLYSLEKDCVTCFQTREFLRNTITEGQVTKDFAKLLAYFSYESKWFSKKVAKNILEGINTNPNQDLVPFFTILQNIMVIEDSLQRKRLEWLFGIGTMIKTFTQLKVTDKPYELIKFGLPLISSIRDTVHDYTSVLTYKFPYDSLLTLMWLHRKALEIQPIACLLELMIKSPAVFDYVNKLPPPNYMYAKYPDWIKSCITGYGTAVKALGIFSILLGKRKDDSGHQTALKLMVEYEKLWAKVAEKNGAPSNSDLLSSFTPPYIIGNSVGENVLWKDNKSIASLTVSEIVTEIYQSLPTGKENLAIPENYFNKPEDKADKKADENNKSKESKNQVKPKEGDNDKQESNAKVATEADAKEEQKAAVEQKIEIKPIATEASVLKIEAINSILNYENVDCKTSVKISVTITEKKPEEGKEAVPANFYVPSSTLIHIVEKQRRVVLHLVPKSILGKGWGDFEIKWKAKPINSKGESDKPETDSPDPDMKEYDIIDDQFFTGQKISCISCGEEFVNDGKVTCPHCGQPQLDF